MLLEDFLEKYRDKLNHLEESFVKNVFFKDYGEKGLDILYPQEEIPREDGSNGFYKIDFVVKTQNNSYAIETHGFHAHDPSGRYVDRNRFNELQRKDNTIRERFDKYVVLSKDQIDDVSEAVFELRRCFKSDKHLFDLYLNRSKGEITPSEPQSKALQNLNDTRAQGHKSGLIVLATGLGKTFLSGFDILQSGSKKILFVAHVDEILRKTKNDFEDLMKDRMPEMEMLSERTEQGNKNIIFSTIQSLHKDKYLKKFNNDFFDYIVIDEAHHAAAKTYQKVLNYFKPKFLLGLTATPFRTDEKEILPSFESNIVYQMDQEQAVQEGYLADIKYLGFFDDIDYSDIRWNGNKYDLDDLNKKLMIKKRDNQILRKYIEQKKTKEKTIGFCTSIEHAEYMTEVFNNNNIKSVAIHSKSESTRSRFTNEEKETLLSRFREDEFEVAFTVNMFNEGIDIPDVSTILMLRPTDSLTIFIQQIGRGLRLSDNKEYLKVLDFIGNYRTSDIILNGLSLSTSDLIHDKEKGVYYYDNKGRNVVFEARVVDIFKAIIAKKSSKPNLDEIDEKWLDYGEFLNQSTQTDFEKKDSITHYWQVDKKRKDLNAQIWAINFVRNNKDRFNNRKDLENELKKNSEKEKVNIGEGLRALFFSKLLGIIDTESPFNTTKVFDKLNDPLQQRDEVVTAQMEKLFFWNDIYSRVNRHASSSKFSKKEAYFSIYTIIFIYQVLAKLHNLNQQSCLSRFELEYFIFFARRHDEVDDMVERIISYRNAPNVYELEKYLKISVKSDPEKNKFNIFDSRYYGILKNTQYLEWSKERIVLPDKNIQIIEDKVEQFEFICSKKDVFPSEGKYGDYRKMLYSSDSFFKYHLK